MKSIISTILLLEIISILLTSCNKREDKIEMITYSSPIIDSIRIPKNTKDFNRFIKDSLYHQSITNGVYAMLEYKPEESFTYPFEYFEDRAQLKTITTPDSLMRFYSFSISYINSSSTLIQYKDSNGKIHLGYFAPEMKDESEVLLGRLPIPHLTEEEEEDYISPGGGTVADINTIVDDRGNNFYLVHYIIALTSREAFHYMVALNLINGVPQKVSIFNTGKKRVDVIDTYLEYYHSDSWKNPDSMFVYNTDTKKLYIPHIQDDEFKEEYLIYEFDGVEFKYKGIH